MMSSKVRSLDIEAAAQRLESVRKKRGYLLPHHGLLALTAPDLLAGYDACYSALTLVERLLTAKDREFIWLGILNVREEDIATQHVSKFLEAGGIETEIELSVQLAAYALGAKAFLFAGTHWSGLLSKYDAQESYMAGLNALLDMTPISKGLLHMAMAANQTCCRHWTQLRWHIGACYELGVPEPELAEALSYTMFTGSIPYFIEGCGVWRDMIREGAVPATKPFKVWADTDQDGPAR